MTAELIFISLLCILIWLTSMVVIKGLIEDSLSTYDKLHLTTVVSIAITLLIVVSRS